MDPHVRLVLRDPVVTDLGGLFEDVEGLDAADGLRSLGQCLARGVLPGRTGPWRTCTSTFGSGARSRAIWGCRVWLAIWTSPLRIAST